LVVERQKHTKIPDLICVDSSIAATLTVNHWLPITVIVRHPDEPNRYILAIETDYRTNRGIDSGAQNDKLWDSISKNYEWISHAQISK
jgi:hypothetical protein